MTNPKHSWFRFKKSKIKLVLFYFLLVTLLSGLTLGILLIQEINPLKGISIFSQAIIGAVFASLLGSSIFYSRKLYKACISLDMLEPVDTNDSIRELGVIFYYIIRPIYAACLSVIVCAAAKSGAEFITNKGDINENFPFLIIVICFFVGYSSGDFIDYLEIKGKKIVQGVFKNDNN